MICNNDYKYHYFYKITNTINNKIYYSIHSTNDLNDGYMGSGRALIRAFKKYGKENFIKEIIKLFNSREELANYEKEQVNDEFIKENNNYNISNGNILIVSTDDPRYISGELVHFTKGYKFTEEQKNHLKESHKKNGHQKGEKNSQFGKRWIHKEGIVIKIKGSDLQKYLDDGWELGMKNKTKN